MTKDENTHRIPHAQERRKKSFLEIPQETVGKVRPPHLPELFVD